MTLKEISKKYKVKIKFIKDNFYYAYYEYNKNCISINKNFLNEKEEVLIPIIFHELGHKYCFDNNIYKAYHFNIDNRLVRLTALKAEKYVDKWASIEMKKNGFDFEYPFYYSNITRQKLLREYLKDNYPN